MIGHKKLLMVGFAALLALGLAACGTTGDDAALVIEPDPTADEMATAKDALERYNTAKVAYETAKDAYDDDMTLATAKALQVAATDMQMEAAAASTAAEDGTAEQMTMATTAVSDAEDAVGAAVQILAAAQRAEDIDAGIIAVAAAKDALERYDIAKMAYETAKDTYDNDMTLATAKALHVAATDMQMEAAAASTAAEDGTAEQMTMATTAVSDAEDAVGAAVQILAPAQRAADIAAGIAAQKAIGDYVAAQLDIDNAFTAYGEKEANEKDAKELVTLANTAKNKALAAQVSANAGGTPEQVTAARVAVTAADKAVMYAISKRDHSITTAEATPFDAKIKEQSTDDAPAFFVVKATRKTDDVTVTVEGGAAMDATTVIAEGAAADLRNGWFRADVTDADVADDDDLQTVTVFTNIENPTKKFTVVHSSVLNAAISSVNNNTGVLELENTGVGVLEAWNTHVSADAFPGPSTGLTINTYDGSEGNQPSKFPGKFDGVDGTYECTGTCTATADGKGALTVLGGMWTFTPEYFGIDGQSIGDDDDPTREDDGPEPSVAVDDTDYLQFGWWTEEDDKGGVEFRTFVHGVGVFTFESLDALLGEATYKGPAAGRYAVRTFNPNATIASIRDGEFTAAATLTAKFSGGDVAVNKQNTISGKITEFAGENDDDLGAWSVTLKEAKFMDLAVDPVFSSMEAGGALGGSPVNSGGWKGQFFGNDLMRDNLPNSVAGEFNAQSSHGAVAGAFGAVKD